MLFCTFLLLALPSFGSRIRRIYYRISSSDNDVQLVSASGENLYLDEKVSVTIDKSGGLTINKTDGKVYVASSGCPTVYTKQKKEVETYEEPKSVIIGKSINQEILNSMGNFNCYYYCDGQRAKEVMKADYHAEALITEAIHISKVASKGEDFSCKVDLVMNQWKVDASPQTKVALIPLYGDLDKITWYQEATNIPIEEHIPFMAIQSESPISDLDLQPMLDEIKKLRSLYLKSPWKSEAAPPDNMKEIIDKLAAKGEHKVSFVLVRNLNNPNYVGEFWMRVRRKLFDIIKGGTIFYQLSKEDLTGKIIPCNTVNNFLEGAVRVNFDGDSNLKVEKSSDVKVFVQPRETEKNLVKQILPIRNYRGPLPAAVLMTNSNASNFKEMCHTPETHRHATCLIHRDPHLTALVRNELRLKYSKNSCDQSSLKSTFKKARVTLKDGKWVIKASKKERVALVDRRSSTFSKIEWITRDSEFAVNSFRFRLVIIAKFAKPDGEEYLDKELSVKAYNYLEAIANYLIGHFNDRQKERDEDNFVKLLTQKSQDYALGFIENINDPFYITPFWKR